jgi:putative FmdB family regulatory protein
MPTYEYKCSDCGEKFDEVQKITEPPLTKCPFCGGAVDRLISGGMGIMFKGSGFYVTDYRSESYKKAADKEKSSETPSKPAAPDKGLSKDKKVSPNKE